MPLANLRPLLGWGVVGLVAAPRLFAAEFKPTPFVTQHCVECHDAQTKKGNLDLTALKSDFADTAAFAKWVKIHDCVAKGEMPPEKKPQPAATERGKFVGALRESLHGASLAQQRAEGRVLVRRLNVTEYETTLRDLLAARVSVRDLLPPDTSAAGFDKVSAVLEMSSVHLLRYQDAAERAQKLVVPREIPQPFKQRITGREVVAKSRHADLNGSLRVDGDALYVHALPYNHITLGTATVPQAGRYVVRASLHAVGTEGRVLPVRFAAAKDWGRESNNVLAVRDAPPEKPVVIELECELGRNDLVDVQGWTLPFQRKWADGKLALGKPLDQYRGPGLVIHWLEIEGPLGEFPPIGYRNVFGDLPLKSRNKYEALRVEPADPRADAERCVRAFLPRAFRRPVSEEMQKHYVQIALGALDRKIIFEEAVLLACRAALCSPHFLLLAEPLGTRASDAAALDDFAVASRLSYFLWSSAPDEELLRLAAKGELTGRREGETEGKRDGEKERRGDGEKERKSDGARGVVSSSLIPSFPLSLNPSVSPSPTLRAQVERMLKDPRAARFTEHFAGQWLDLKKINDTTPSPQTYGEFDEFLFWSMPRETTQFFEEILRADRNVTEFVHSDWGFLNERLAQHYGVTGVIGGEFRRVALPADAHRGGVLTHASILKVTADGTKTSPILRGKWVVERILGQPPAPPPPNVPAVEPDIRGATTVRQQLDKHRNIESCNACHRHIDPPGFALEAYDVIGGWREFYRSSVYKREAAMPLPNYPGRTMVRGAAVETDGVTPAGRAFKNLDDYKQLLLADKDQLARSLAEKLLIYATGAEIQFADREVIEQLVAQSRAQNYGFRSLVHAVVQSRIFLSK